jgi:hypothetical protein
VCASADVAWNIDAADRDIHFRENSVADIGTKESAMA